jgi:hypothetical protein
LIDELVNPKLADDFFRLGGAIFVRGETLDVWHAVFHKQHRFDDFEGGQIKK